MLVVIQRQMTAFNPTTPAVDIADKDNGQRSQQGL